MEIAILARRLTLTVVILTCLAPMPFAVKGDQDPSDERPGDSQRLAEFFALSLRERHLAFPSLSDDDQIAVAVWAERRRHPPDFEFAYEIAQRGRGVIPFLKKRLPRSSDQEAVTIARVLRDMDRFVIDLAAEHDLLKQLRARLKKVADESLRVEGESIRQDLENNAAPPIVVTGG